jgi:DNA mismatch repair protein MutL
MGIADAKARSGEAVLVVQHAASKAGGAGGIDENFCATVLDHAVIGGGCAHFHYILETGAAALFHAEAQAIARALGGDQIAQRLRGLVRNRDHILFLGTIPCKVKFMGRIRLLADEVASQVAAGEVVERPASVVKELVENSIDAGARRIVVEFARGGTRLLRVVDDGCGMDRDDALLSLERHATSKIRSAEDLASVSTMGFRGEALPSIASVSRFRLTTRPGEAAAGTEIRVAGGRIESVADCGGAPGTSIEVESIFFNLPARKKFLRGEETESAHIVHQMQSLAVAHPEVGMTLVRDGRRLWQAAPTDDPGVRLRDLFGGDFLSRLIAVDPMEENGIGIEGFVAKPGEGRPDRELQFVVLNRRVVQCPAVFQSLREAYAEALPRGRHPLAVLRITMDPLAFDCNVHPAKREVRLHRPDLLRQVVYLAAGRALESLKKPVAVRATGPAETTAPLDAMPAEPRPAAVASATSFRPPPQLEMPVALPAVPAPVGSGFRLLGGLGGRWIVMEGEDGLVLLDTRAASERILFETMRREASGGRALSQRLLIPVVVELTAKDAIWINENRDPLGQAGFSVEPFGGDSFKVEAVPACLGGRDPREALIDVCETLKATGLLGGGQPVLDALIRSVSRIAAINGFAYDEGRARRLVDELLGCELPYACPQGRPTMIQWSFPELERKFGR